jgi:LDH2 family malate/lactate/ureidoglycolate dehydrogenase
VDKKAQPATDARTVCPGLVSGNHFILPLGGQDEDFSGHKGYNLAVLVDILSAALSGGAFGPDTRTHPWDAYPGALLSHFFGVINIAAFRDPADFRSDMDRMLKGLRDCPPAPGQERVYYAGLKESEHAKECKQLGIPLTPKTYESLCTLGKETNIQPPVIC